jgi:signal transduction histidine kinase
MTLAPNAPIPDRRAQRAAKLALEQLDAMAWRAHFPARIAAISGVIALTALLVGFAWAALIFVFAGISTLIELRLINWARRQIVGMDSASEAQSARAIAMTECGIAAIFMIYALPFGLLAFAPGPGPVISILLSVGMLCVIIGQHVLTPRTALMTIPGPALIAASAAYALSAPQYALAMVVLALAAIANALILVRASMGSAHSLIAAQLDAEDAAVLLEQRVRERTAELEAAKIEAEAANLAKSQFIANMSHELRTPLNAIIGYTELMTESAAEEDRANDVRDHGRIRGAADRLLRLIGEVLDVSKIEAGRMEYEVRAFDVAEMVGDVEHTLRPIVEANWNNFDVEIAADLGEAVGDGFKLSQCLINLLSNAAKFTENGKVSLSARRSADGDWLEFVVRDSGIGMREEAIARLFKPFAQADASTTRAYGGTGLGLYISHSIALLLGGDLTVESAPGAGTAFTLRVPAAAGAPVRQLSAA